MHNKEVFLLHVIYCLLATKKNSFMSGIQPGSQGPLLPGPRGDPGNQVGQESSTGNYFGQFLPARLLICETVNLELAFAAFRKRD